MCFNCPVEEDPMNCRDIAVCEPGEVRHILFIQLIAINFCNQNGIDLNICIITKETTKQNMYRRTKMQPSIYN